jgi:uncharacterized protein YbjQ (UPF0145 family)
LGTKPLPTGSVTYRNTIGSVCADISAIKAKRMREELARIAADMKSELRDIRDGMVRWRTEKLAEVAADFDRAEEHARQHGADDVVFVRIDSSDGPTVH